MSMDVRRARQIIKQRNKTAFFVQEILEHGHTDTRSLFEMLRKRGWKESQGLLNEMLTALTVAGKVSSHKGVWRLVTDEEPVMQTPRVAPTMKAVWPELKEWPGSGPVKESHILPDVDFDTYPLVAVPVKEEPMIDMSKLSPEQLVEMSGQLSKLAEKMKQEDTGAKEHRRALLEAAQGVCDAADLLVEATDKLRAAMTEVRAACGLPTTRS